ncbi:MAG: ribosome recycling factor [Nevskiales bacterium]
MIENARKDARKRMAKCVDVLRQDLLKIRTGRAHPSLLDHVRVDYYGTETPIGQCANVVTEDARTLSITAWDRSMIQVIEKAIMTSDLGLNPSTAGTVIRIVLPALTEERRKELVKVVRSEGEDARIAIRNVRRDSNQALKDMLKEKKVSEDEQKRGEQDIQKLTDQYIAEVDKQLEEKEKELMAV